MLCKIFSLCKVGASLCGGSLCVKAVQRLLRAKASVCESLLCVKASVCKSFSV